MRFFGGSGTLWKRPAWWQMDEMFELMCRRNTQIGLAFCVKVWLCPKEKHSHITLLALKLFEQSSK